MVVLTIAPPRLLHSIAPEMDKIAAISQQLLQFSPDALIVVDSRGIILFANATSRALFGYSREQLVGQTLDLLVPERFRIRHGAHVGGYLRDPTAREMGARIIDLDILLYDAAVVKKKTIKIPHPEMPKRKFVLIPLSEIAPQVIHPELGVTISELLINVKDDKKIHLFHS